MIYREEDGINSDAFNTTHLWNQTFKVNEKF